MSEHALLSASGSHRWLHCSPSARLEQEFADRETEAAAEGTAAHALAEHKLKRALKRRTKRPVSQYETDEMNEHTDDYVSFVLESIEQAKLRCNDPIVLIEQHLDFSCYVPDGFGTGDALIVGDGVLHIIDFKYGRGVLVSATDNPQMMLYALGALEQFDNLYDIAEVRIRFEYAGEYLFIRLPSGRRLAYREPAIVKNRFGNESVSYAGSGESRKWMRIESYGPKFTENIVQAIARDLLVEAMQRLDKAGYEIVMHVHDEAVIEATSETRLERICTIMGETPEWAAGLPLRADGYVCDFYQKD